MNEETSADNLQEFKGRGEEKHTVVSSGIPPVFAWQLGVPLFCLLQPRSHILPLLKGSSKVYSRKKPAFPLTTVPCFYFAFLLLWCCWWSQERLGSLLAPACVNRLGQSCSWENAAGVQGLLWMHAERAGRIRRCKGQWMRAKDTRGPSNTRGLSRTVNLECGGRHPSWSEKAGLH